MVRFRGWIVSAAVLVLAVVASRATAVDIYDGFEAYAAGGYPGGNWVMRYNALTEPAQNKVVTSPVYSGSKSLQLHGGGWAAVASMQLPAESDPFLVYCAMEAGNLSGSGAEGGMVLAHSYTGTGSTPSGGIGFRADDTMAGWIPDVFEDNVAYTPYQWYHLQIGALPAYKRLFYTFNGRYVGCRNVPDADWPSNDLHIQLGANGLDGTVWSDEVRARSASSAGPYLEPMSFLTDAIEDYLAGYAGPMNVPIPFDIIPQYVSDLYSGASLPIPAALSDQCDNMQTDVKWIGALCNVDLTVTDPLGRTVDKDGGTLPGASYLCEDLDGDGDNEVTILLDTTSFVLGDYTVDVSNPDPDDCETFSLFYYDPDLELLIPICVGEELAGGGSAQYDFTAVPEPATVSLLVLGSGLAMLLRRRE